MEELAVYNTQQQGIVLSMFEKNIIYARSEKQVTKVNPATLIKSLTHIIKSTYFKAGFEIHASSETKRNEQILLIAEAFASQLTINYPLFTVKDVELAFDRGVMRRFVKPDGKFNDYNTLSVAVFGEWLKLYNTERMEAIQKNYRIEQNAKQLAEPEISETEKEKIIRNAVFEAFKIFKTKGEYNDYGNCVYDYIDSKGLINFTKEQKQEFMTQAKMEVYNTKPSNEFEEMIKAIEKKDKKTINVVVSMAKKIALREYFMSIENLNI